MNFFKIILTIILFTVSTISHAECALVHFEPKKMETDAYNNKHYYPVGAYTTVNGEWVGWDDETVACKGDEVIVRWTPYSDVLVQELLTQKNISQRWYEPVVEK